MKEKERFFCLYSNNNNNNKKKTRAETEEIYHNHIATILQHTINIKYHYG